MKTTIAIPTYARISFLQEALWCSIHQTIPVKVLILNDCPQQTLVCDRKNVTCVNIKQKYPTLGAKRNKLLELIETEYVCWLDDDDLIIPQYVEDLEKSFLQFSDFDLLQPRKVWRLYGNCPQDFRWEESYAAMPGLGKVKACLGKFSEEKNKGEDKDFRSKLKSTRVDVCTGYIYRLSKTIVHTSGNGKIDIIADAERRIKIGLEPKGTIKLESKLHNDYFKTGPEKLRNI